MLENEEEDVVIGTFTRFYTILSHAPSVDFISFWDKASPGRFVGGAGKMGRVLRYTRDRDPCVSSTSR